MLRRGHLASLLCRRGVYYGINRHYVRYASRKAIRPFLLADIGEGITECEVIKWSVKPSTVVSTFDPLCEVQSDKATVEITSPYDGVVREIIVKEGEIAKVGAGLCLIEIDEESGDVDHAANLGTPIATAGKPTEDKSTTTPPPQSVRHAPSPPPKQKHPLDPSNAGATTKPSDAHVQATPSVRHYARQMGITDLSVLHPGSGRDGRIEKVDVKSYLERGSTTTSTPVTETLRATSTVTQQADVKIDLGRTRYAMWKAMTKSLEIPHFGYSSTLDLTALNAMLSPMNTYIPDRYKPPVVSEFPLAVSPEAIWGSSAPAKSSATDPASYYDRLTILPLLLKALSRAMQDWPLFRSSLNPQANSDDRPSLTVRPTADIAVAVSTSTGLYTPVIQSVNTKNPYEIMGELRRFQSLGKRVPAGFTPNELPRRGATISVSNVGAIGKGEWAAPLLVPGGGVAIVAIGRAKWVERMGEKRLEVGVSWSADHRIVEGAELAAFVESWRSWVEEPARLIADGR